MKITFENLCQGAEAAQKAVTKPQGCAFVTNLLPPHPAPLALHGAAVRGAAASTPLQQSWTPLQQSLQVRDTSDTRSWTPLQQSLPSAVTLPGVVCLCHVHTHLTYVAWQAHQTRLIPHPTCALWHCAAVIPKT